MSIHLLLISVAVVAFSGVPGLFLTRKSDLGQWIASILNLIGAVLAGFALILHYLNSGRANQISMNWSLPLGQFAVAVDDLSLIFLIPIFLIPALGSIYGLSYWKQAEHAGNGRKLALSWGLLTAGMALVVLARDGVLLLMAWEIMALAGFFLTTTEENKPEVRAAGWVYLVATHMGTLCLLGFFALLRQATGSYDLWPSPAAFPRMSRLGCLGWAWWDLASRPESCLCMSGFPAHCQRAEPCFGNFFRCDAEGRSVWTDSCRRPNGPSTGMVGRDPFGCRHTLRRLCNRIRRRSARYQALLAYSSIENVGIIVMGIGLAALGRSLDRSDWVVLGLAGALLHVLNHSLFKPLLFFGAGNILHATHTREMDLLGGLGKKMPRTFILCVIGAVAICGLPPLNGFVSELFVFMGLFRTATAASAGSGWAALAAPALALVGAIAVATFVKLVGAVFAGSPRSAHGTHAHDPDLKMLAPMWIIAGCCGVIGVLPATMIPLLNRAITAWSADIRVPSTNVGSYLPVGWITVIAMLFLALATAGAVWFGSRQRD